MEKVAKWNNREIFMSKAHAEHTTAFAEVFPTSQVTYPQNRSVSGNDNHLMLYFQGVKVYIPDGCKQETLLTTLLAIKQL